MHSATACLASSSVLHCTLMFRLQLFCFALLLLPTLRHISLKFVVIVFGFHYFLLSALFLLYWDCCCCNFCGWLVAATSLPIVAALTATSPFNHEILPARFFCCCMCVFCIVVVAVAANILSPQIRVRSFFDVLSLIITALHVFV